MFINQLIKFLKKMKTKKNIAEKSAESQCDNIYMYRINTYLTMM